MTEQINTVGFPGISRDAMDFYEEYGFVVLDNCLPDTDIQEMQNGFAQLVTDYSSEMGMSREEYLIKINQWRDLWEQSGQFRDVLRSETVHGLARHFMRQGRVQLLHDHIISKPYRGCENVGKSTNQTLPWHQDYPFWPVNTPHSLSLWIPFDDVSATGGCMEIVKGSHKWGASAPVDFIMDDPEKFRDRDDLDFIRIPVTKGQVAVLHSLTWHRSHPNRDAGTERRVYIILWIPAGAEYTPDATGWHPLNERIRVEPGERLNTDKFPVFGEEADEPGQKAEYAIAGNQPRLSRTMDMFHASAHIANQINELMEWGNNDGLEKLLATPQRRTAIAERCIEFDLIEDSKLDDMLELLERLETSSLAYAKHKARNVFNDAYADWWRLIGMQLRKDAVE